MKAGIIVALPEGMNEGSALQLIRAIIVGNGKWGEGMELFVTRNESTDVVCVKVRCGDWEEAAWLPRVPEATQYSSERFLAFAERTFGSRFL